MALEPRSGLCAALILALLGGAACGAEHALPGNQAKGAATPRQQVETMRMSITIGGDVLTATLNDSVAAREFAAMLPLTLTLEGYNGTEKVADLPGRLTRRGAPAGFDPSAGDITYYAPWGNLAIFYRDFSYSDGLISLGRIDAGSDILARRGRVQAAFALAEAPSD